MKDTRTEFYYKGVLLRLDGQPDLVGDIFDSTTFVDYLRFGSVEVYLYSKRALTHHVGMAILTKSEKEVRYCIKLFPGRIQSILEMERLVPCSMGTILKRTGSHVDSLVIDGISLELRGMDARITPLSQNLAEPPAPFYYKVSTVPVSCECGSEKAGLGTHSHWCPKHVA